MSKGNNVLDLEKCIDKEVRVKFQGGREGASRHYGEEPIRTSRMWPLERDCGPRDSNIRAPRGRIKRPPLKRPHDLTRWGSLFGDLARVVFLRDAKEIFALVCVFARARPRTRFNDMYSQCAAC